MADQNLDVVDHATGEIYFESLERKAAIDEITREGWEIVSETSDTLWVNSGIDLASEEEMRRRAAAWWKYEEGGGQVR
jgi:hypothetical protein